MTCDDLADAIEPWAAGDAVPVADALAHLEACAHCQAALATARRLEMLLAAGSKPAAPPHFTDRVLRQVRGEWWRNEELIDRAFNAGLGLLLVVVGAGVWVALLVTGAAAVMGDTFGLVGLGITEAMNRISPSLSPLLAATLLVVGTLLAWRWVEGDTTG